MENPNVGAPKLNHVNVQQCFVVHVVPMKKHGGMKHGIDVTLSAGEALCVWHVLIEVKFI
jgi:hypothetical protein